MTAQATQKEQSMADTELVRWFDTLGRQDVGIVGGKNASLGEMRRTLTPLGIRTRVVTRSGPKAMPLTVLPTVEVEVAEQIEPEQTLVEVVHALRIGVGGELGDDVVLRVRAGQPDFWRGQTFATFDGRVWHADVESGELLGRADVVVPPAFAWRRSSSRSRTRGRSSSHCRAAACRSGWRSRRRWTRRSTWCASSRVGSPPAWARC